MKMKKKNVFLLFLFWLAIGCTKNNAQSGNSNSSNSSYTGTGSITQGMGTVTANAIYSCTGGRNTNVGTIKSNDGKSWVVPGENNFSNGTKLFDLYNECNGKTPANISLADTGKAPIIVIDDDGEVISGFLYGDNYFELYVNGKLVGVDPVPYTPFNSCFVKFKAKRPIKYAVKLIDWEENLGIGSELNGGNSFYPGDGGFVAKFSDGTVTNSSWKAQTFYIAPLSNVNCVTEVGSSRKSSSCSPYPSSAAASYALHWEIPANWFSTSFDFQNWPAASNYTSAEVGPKVSFTNFASQFNNAQFIWSSNLILDNLVLLRYDGL
jgi:hypothetical protein